MSTISQTAVRNFFQLDSNKTYEILQKMSAWDLLGDEFAPYNSTSWRENPFTKIANDDALWSAYCGIHPGKVTLASFFQSLAICQFFILNNIRGPEGDGAKQMLRKHWYSWAKLALQPAAVRLGTGLMDPNDPNSPPDSEKLYDLMSSTFGTWNEQGLLEYRSIWIENNTTKWERIGSHLPEPYDLVVICCEKDAAYNGVLLSAQAMGARAVYSGGGKSSRSGIELLYHEALEWGVRYGRTVYVLVISDWDTDGESVIAPAFVNQLSTYVPEEQIRWKRVGIFPEQIERFGYDFASKWYEAKYNVKGQVNYLLWCKEKACFEHDCPFCGEHSVVVGVECPNCHQIQLPTEEDDEYFTNILSGKMRSQNGDRDALEQWKQQYLDFYQQTTPHGFELDAFTRTEYCALLVEGLAELLEWDDLCEKLSAERLPYERNVEEEIVEILLSRNEDYGRLDEHIDKLEAWFNKRLEQLRTQRTNIQSDASKVAQRLIEAHRNDEEIFAEDPECTPDNMAEYMRNQRPGAYVEAFNPYDQSKREELFVERIKEEEEDAIEEFGDTEYPFDELDLE